MNPSGVLALVFARPLGLTLFVLPVLLLIWAVRRGRPTTVVTGTFDLWDFGSLGRGRKSRRFPPLGIWLSALALVAGVLALAGPRERTGSSVVWRVVLDPRPSMGLAPPGGNGAEETRAEAGVREALSMLAEIGGAEDEVEWSSPGRPSLLLPLGKAPPSTWTRVGSPAPTPGIQTLDRAGTLFITDLAPEPRLSRAGFVATGAQPAPGPVGADGGDLIVWNGRGLERKSGAAPERSVLVRGSEPAVLARMIEAWSVARGFELVRAKGDSELALEIVFEGGEEALEVRVGRDGWSASATIAAESGVVTDGGTPWLSAGAAGGELTVVGVHDGRVRTTLLELGEPSGDPASFAVSWSTLLDNACRMHAGSVSLQERSRSGSARAREPSPPGRPSSDSKFLKGGLLDAWLSLAAVLALAAAMVVSERFGLRSES